MRVIPLHVNPASDPARRRSVVGGLDFDAAVQMHGALAIKVIAKRLDRQRQQRWFLFREHGRELPLGRTVNPRVGPALLPVIQIRADRDCRERPLRWPLRGYFDGVLSAHLRRLLLAKPAVSSASVIAPTEKGDQTRPELARDPSQHMSNFGTYS